LNQFVRYFCHPVIRVRTHCRNYHPWFPVPHVSTKRSDLQDSIRLI
jgi:hypothetical protein